MRKSVFLFAIVIIGYACSNDNLYSPDDIDLDLNEFEYTDENGALLSSDDNQKAALGRALFYDTRMSRNDRISCASCHEQTKSFCDGEQFSIGLFGESTSRNSMALINVGRSNRMFWDLSGDNMNLDILNPVTNHVEMGLNTLEELKLKLSRTELYPKLFKEVYGTADFQEAEIGESLALFVSSITSLSNKFDQGQEDEYAQYSEKEMKGKELFFESALCGTCHNGVDFNSSWGKNIGLDLEYTDEGAGSGFFKVPTLRNIALTAPYMHDGRFSTLEEVVEHYNSGVNDHPNLSWQLSDENKNPIRLNLSTDDKEALVAFLHTLTDRALLEDPKLSNPF